MGRQEGQRVDETDGHDANHSLDYREEEGQEELLEAQRERKFLLKLDACLMTWAWLAYLIKVSFKSGNPMAYAM
jgi:hypothetical protein